MTYWDAIEVSQEDAALLDVDVMLYGNAYVEVFESGPAKRIDPARIGRDIQIEDSPLLRLEK